MRWSFDQTPHPPRAADGLDAVTDLVIISRHEKGFWQADFYAGASHLAGDEIEQLGLVPDSFRTFLRGITLEEAKALSATRWPNAEVKVALDEEDEEEES